MSDYPYPDGDVTVLGPEIFASDDESVICWRGENYIPQAQAIEAIGWISAELATRAGAWDGNAPDWFPQPPDWLDLWQRALDETARSTA